MPVHHSVTDNIHRLTLDFVPMITLDLGTLTELTETISRLADLRQPVVLTGTDRAFSAGVNTRFFEACSGNERAEMVLGITRLTAAMLAIEAPLVAAIIRQEMPAPCCIAGA